MKFFNPLKKIKEFFPANPVPLETLKNPKELISHLSYLCDLKFEKLFIICTDWHGKVVYEKCVSHNRRKNFCTFHPEDVLNKAVKAGARNMYMCHNHPSGYTIPSMNDYKATRNMIENCLPNRIKFKAHVILGKISEYTGSPLFRILTPKDIPETFPEDSVFS